MNAMTMSDDSPVCNKISWPMLMILGGHLENSQNNVANESVIVISVSTSTLVVNASCSCIVDGVDVSSLLVNVDIPNAITCGYTIVDRW